MAPDRLSPPHGWPSQNPDKHARIVVDERGVEWEVYDEATWSIGLAMEWDYLPQSHDHGLILVSHLDRRRIWPCPENWKELTDYELAGLLTKARSII